MDEYRQELIDRLIEFPREILLEVIKNSHTRKELCEIVIDKHEDKDIEKMLKERGL